MERMKIIGIAVVIAILGAVALFGFRYLQYERVQTRLLGTWEQVSTMEDIEAGLHRMAVERAKSDDAISELPSNDPANDEGDTVIPLGDLGLESVLQVSLRTTIRFEEDGRFTVAIGDRASVGRWVLSNAKGKRKTVVARVMQTPTFEQRLVIHMVFDGDDKMVVSDEEGVENVFIRVADES